MSRTEQRHSWYNTALLMPFEPSSRAKSTVRHTRAIQRDRRQRPVGAPPDPAWEAHLTELIHPATLAHVHAYHALGLRARTLTLPIMLAFVLSLIWRQVGPVQETVRWLQRAGLLWTAPLLVSQPAISQRLPSLPAELFAAVYHAIVPPILRRWQARPRPLAPALAWAHTHFVGVWARDGSTRDGLLRHAGLLRETVGTPLAGRMVGLRDGAGRVPRQLWSDPDRTAHDQSCWERVLPARRAGRLLLIDLGGVNYSQYDQLTERGVWLLTRAKTNAATHVRRVLAPTATLRAEVVTLGSAATACAYPMRLIPIYYQGHWYRYLTNALDPTVLPAEYVAALYGHRWRIEEAFATVKRLLGLAIFGRAARMGSPSRCGRRGSCMWCWGTCAMRWPRSCANPPMRCRWNWCIEHWLISRKPIIVGRRPIQSAIWPPKPKDWGCSSTSAPGRSPVFPT